METIITRETDIIREYLAALDARERDLSPFARLAAIVKLAHLKGELASTELETTEQDLRDLRREIDERLTGSWLRKLASGKWGARLLMFLMQVGLQQVILALCWLATLLFVKFIPRPSWWNPLLPHEEPVSLYLFVFLFFFVTPILAFAALFAGRFFRSWQKTLPVSLLILALSVGGTYLVVRRLDQNLTEKNPVQKSASLTQFAKEQGVTVQNYHEWVKQNWLMSDSRFQKDYENYLRNGPGRWVTAKLGTNDVDWRDGLPVISEYVTSGPDPNGFRQWLQYYLERNRITSEDGVESTAQAITGDANQQYLSIFQVEPFLRERDERSYRAYLGSVNIAMKKWGLLSLSITALLLLLYYLVGPALTFAEQLTGRSRRARRLPETELITDESDLRATPSKSAADKFKERYYNYPERREVLSNSYDDTPFRLMINAHRAFVTLAVFTSVAVMALWAALYAYDLLNGKNNAPSQTALMRSYLLFGGQADDRPGVQTPSINANAAQFVPDNTVSTYGVPAEARLLNGQGNVALADNLSDLGQQFDETSYQTNKRFKEQMRTIAAQASEIGVLKSLSTQLQQTTSQFPNQVADVGSRANAAEARAGQIINEINEARQKVDNLERIFATKLGEVDNRASRAAELVGKIEDQASVLSTRTEALEKELDRRARQIEARTEELGERTASLKELEDRIARLQRATFSAMVLNFKAEVEGLDRRLDSGFYRTLNKGSAQRDAKALRDRIAAFSKELRDIGTDQSKSFADQLDGLAKRLDQIAAKAQ